MQDSKGSIWRKWDLHFHSPASYDYKSKQSTNQEIIDELIRNDIAVVAITDHHFIDTERIKELQKIASGKMIIFPGIEFRSDMILSDSLHFIGLFPENSDIDRIWDILRVKLEINPSKVHIPVEEAKLSFSLDKASEIIHDLGGIITAHAGTKSNSFENITNSFSHTQELKKNILVSGKIDILEVGKVADLNAYNNIVFPNINKALPLIICSDNHDIKNYVVKENLWIKGDPNFTTLRQLLNQPDRAYIGNKPIGLQNIEDNPTKYIEKIEINKISGSTFEETWFNEVNIPINSGLVAIIGNKGNGKSALTDILGLCGNTHNFRGFSFLNDKKFKKNKDEKSGNFEATLTWNNGKAVNLCLNHDIDTDFDELIKYIPQSHLETLCVSIEGGDFEEELRSIIFSHIPQTNRLGKNSLEDLINHKTQIVRNDIEKLKGNISIVNGEIILLEAKEHPSFLIKLEENLRRKEEELFAHQQSKPLHQEPPVDSGKIGDSSEVIELLRAESEQIIESIAATNSNISKLNKDIEILKQRRQSLESLNKSLDAEKSANRDSLEIFNLDVESIFSFKINLDPVTELINTKSQELESQQTSISSTSEKVQRVNNIRVELDELQSQLNQPAKLYQLYLNSLEKWKAVEQDINGSSENEGSIINILATIEYVKNQLKTDLKAKEIERRDLIKEIFQKKLKILNDYKGLYKSVTEFISTHESLLNSYKISFDTLFKENDLYKKFESFVNFGSKGSFYGLNEGRAKLEDLFTQRSFSDENDTFLFVNDILRSLKFDIRKGELAIGDTKSQLKSGVNVLDFYNYICSLDYLMPAYDLKLSDKNVSTLSPGERGALLLIFYLILDNDNIPLIIDQPEENLDNQSVYNILVPFIKMAKSKRQVIIVTHNPNLAVVCDADQIIHIRIDKENKNKVVIQSGGLENPDISAKIVEILEGTYPAFSTRINAYNLHRV